MTNERDTLLIGGTGRTDLPTGEAGCLFDSLFHKLLRLDPETRVYPAHIYSDRAFTTIGAEIADNKRLQVTDRDKFIAMMQSLNLTMPEHLSEALRTNLSGSKTVEQMLKEKATAVKSFTLYVVGEGIEKKVDDFAAEVAAQVAAAQQTS